MTGMTEYVGDGELGASFCFLLCPHQTLPGEGHGWCWGTSLSLAFKVGPSSASLGPLSRAPPVWRSPQETSCSPGLIARIAHSIFLILSFSFSFSPAASCEGLSGSGLEALGLEAAGTGKTGLGLEQDRGTTSAHPSSLEPFSHPFCSSARSAMVVKPFLKPQCDLGVFPSSSHPSYLDLGPGSQPCLAVRIWP